MNTYSIGSDSSRWWWPSAAAGAVGAAAIAAILLLPATGSPVPGGTTPQAPTAPGRDPWYSTVEPADRPCYALPPRHTAGLDTPTCGQRPVIAPWSGIGGQRPGLDVRP